MPSKVDDARLGLNQGNLNVERRWILHLPPTKVSSRKSCGGLPMNDLAQQLLKLRDEEARPYWHAALTRSAQKLATLEGEQPDERGCRRCGSALPAQDRGRPRKWCQAPECQKLRKNGGKSPAKRRMSQV
jgi:predicted RNA-binding Zn ribbon-like protein